MLVNYDVLNLLKEDLGDDVIQRLLGMYRTDAATLVDKLCSESGVVTTSRECAHTLAGMSENLGIQLVGTTAREIMKASHDNPDTIPSLIETLQGQFKQTLEELAKIYPEAPQG